MRTKESGLFTSTVLNRARLNGDKTIILNFYRSKGYLEAGIEEAISFNKDQSEMNIILHIKEGSQVIVRKILFDGNTVLSDQDLRKNIVLAEGMPYNEDQTRLDRFNLLAIYAQNGFLSTQIDVKPSITDDKQGIKLVYRIQER
jgi:outer membrane protein insertion porin family